MRIMIPFTIGREVSLSVPFLSSNSCKIVIFSQLNQLELQIIILAPVVERIQQGPPKA